MTTYQGLNKVINLSRQMSNQECSDFSKGIAKEWLRQQKQQMTAPHLTSRDIVNIFARLFNPRAKKLI